MSETQSGLWKHSNFMKFWIGHTVSRFGSRITDDALPATAVLVLAAAPGQLGWLVAIESVPVLLVSLFAGVWVDRLRKRPLMIAADLGRALLLASVPAAALLHLLRIEQLFVVAALAGVLTVVFDVADQSFLPRLVSRERIAEGNSRLSVSGSVAEVTGPAIGGSLIQIITAPFTIAVDAISFVISAVSIASIRTEEPPPLPLAERGDVRSGIVAGLRLVLHNPVLRAMAASAGMRNFFGSFFAALYWPFAVRELGLAPAAVGALISVGGASGLVGALIAGPVTRRLGLGSAMVGTALLGALTALLVPLASGGPLAAAAYLFASQALGDACGEIYAINEVSLRQASVPDHLLGRANATTHFIAAGALPLGAITAGLLADQLGMRLMLLIAALGMVAAKLWIVFSPVRHLRNLPGQGDHVDVV